IFVVLFLGIFFKRLNKQGALSALFVGLFLGIFRLAIDTPVMLGDITYTKGSFFWIINNIFFQYYRFVIFLVCIAVMFGVSYMTDPPNYEKISGLTYGTLTAEDKAATRSTWNWWDVALSVLLVGIILFIYSYFS